MKRMIALLAVLLLCGCTKQVDTQYYMMDTVMSFSLEGAQTKEAEAALSEKISALERVFSPTLPESELVRVNAASGSEVSLSKTFADVLEISLKASEETGGAFDVTLGSVIALWQKQEVPPSALLEAQITGNETVDLSNRMLKTEPGVQLNFGAVAKGYAADCAKTILEEYEIPRALLSLGGNIYAKGEKADGRPWQVGVRDPNGTASDWLGILQVRDKFVIASGDYERYFEQGGVRYHHILDPKTRAPAQSDLRETVVVNTNGSRGDILSTALFVMGEDEAIAFWRARKDFEMILVSQDGRVLITPNLKETFTLTNDTYELEVVA